MTGKLHSKFALEMSMKKAKALSKKMNITYNDLAMGLVSKCVKQYFISQKDDSKYISIAVPFTFNTIPKKVSDYTFGNKFASITIYLPLEEDFE